MGWIKRNLFFVIGVIVALGMLGWAGFFIYQGWSLNSQASGKLNEIYGKLQELASQQPQPGNKQTDNTQIARDQDKQLHDWIAQAGQYFKPIPPIPAGAAITSAAYAEALRQTIDTLQHEADNASVILPPKYDFSFSAQRSLVVFAAGSLQPLAVQLGEVKAISEILFAARINELVGIQRVRVSDDDVTQGSQMDYIDASPVTNDLAIITPYVVTFRGFSPELAKVVSGFANSPHPFIVKSVSVQPANAVASADNAGSPDAYPQGGAYGQGAYGPGGAYGAGGAYGPGGAYGYRYRGMPPPTAAPTPQPLPGRGGLPTVLKEQLLNITVEVDIVKLLPKS
jgi:hypothetical protein